MRVEKTKEAPVIPCGSVLEAITVKVAEENFMGKVLSDGFVMLSRQNFSNREKARTWARAQIRELQAMRVAEGNLTRS